MSLPLDTGGGQGFTLIRNVMMAPIAFDVDYRKRRLHFPSKAKNRLYRLLDKSRFPGFEPTVVDRLKREFYLHLDAWQQCEEVGYFSFRVCSSAFTKRF